MPQTLDALERSLKQPEVGPLYLISGDESLLVSEAAEAVIARAAALGFSEREIHFGDDGQKFRFNYLREQAGAASLFASTRVLDIRVPRSQIDRAAASAIVEYLERPSSDVCVVIRTGQFEARQRNTAWFKKLDQAASTVLIWPLKERELVPWLARRAEKAGFRLSQDALRFLAMQVEGNLLAAAQEIEKLSVMAGDDSTPLSLNDVRTEVANSAHFNGFQLVDAALEGSPRRVARLIRSLVLEGEEPMRLLGLVVSQLRMMAGGGRQIPPFKRRLMESALTRVGTAGVQALLRDAEQIDRQVKGVEPGDPWRSMERLLLGLSGVRLTRSCSS